MRQQKACPKMHWSFRLEPSAYGRLDGETTEAMDVHIYKISSLAQACNTDTDVFFLSKDWRMMSQWFFLTQNCIFSSKDKRKMDNMISCILSVMKGMGEARTS